MITCWLSGWSFYTERRPRRNSAKSGAVAPRMGCGRLWSEGSRGGDSLWRLPTPQQAWLGLTWSAAHEAPGKGRCFPLGPGHCLSKSFSMEPNRRPLPRAQEKWSQWSWASLSGQALPLNLGWVFLVPTWASPLVMDTDIYRKHIGVPVPEVEGQSALGPGRAWGSAQGGG